MALATSRPSVSVTCPVSVARNSWAAERFGIPKAIKHANPSTPLNQPPPRRPFIFKFDGTVIDVLLVSTTLVLLRSTIAGNLDDHALQSHLPHDVLGVNWLLSSLRLLHEPDLGIPGVLSRAQRCRSRQ